MIKETYEILEKIITNALPNIREVDYYLEQYQQNGRNTWHVPSGVYVEFIDIQADQEGANAQLLTIQLRLHLVHECLYDDNQRVKDTAINHLQEATNLFKALNGNDFYLSELAPFAALAGTNNDRIVINRLVRSGITTDHGLQSRIATIQEFTCVVYDYSAMLEQIAKQASLVVNASIQ